MARYRDKPDANLVAIVRAFENQGAVVHRIGRPLDLLVGYRHRWALVEVKNPDGKNRLNPFQTSFMRECELQRLPAYVVHSGQAVCTVLDHLVANWPIPYNPSGDI